MEDLIIVGAGAAGLTAAIYASRAGLKYRILDQDGFGGGQIMSSHRVDNYPGQPAVSGMDLSDTFRNHAEALGAQIEFGKVEKIRNREDHKELVLEEGEVIRTKAVIVATGAVPRILDVPGEQEYTGRGVSYCAVCDGSFYSGKDVLVIGGGDTAIGDALYLSAFCRRVTIALRRDTFRGAKDSVDRLLAKENIEVCYQAQLLEVVGDTKVTKAILWSDDPAIDGEFEIPVEGIFIAVGVQPVSECLKELPLVFDEGYVAAGEDCCTTIPGLYVAGDLRRKPLRQVITAAADGANAVNSAVDWLQR